MTGFAPADDMFIRRTSGRAQVLAMRSLALLVALMPVAAHSETIRLTPEQAEAAIEAGAARKTRAHDQLPDLPQLDRGVHGELGVAVGTGGYRSVYGAFGVPLGDTGGLMLGFGEERGRALGWSVDPCRGIRADICNWQMNGALLEPSR